jgi:hypothetical protein
MSTSEFQKLARSPTLNTIRMVEKALKSTDNSVITVAELKRNLPRQVNHNVLITILEYLEESNKIYVGIKGITWIENNSRKMREALAKAVEH